MKTDFCFVFVTPIFFCFVHFLLVTLFLFLFRRETFEIQPRHPTRLKVRFLGFLFFLQVTQLGLKKKSIYSVDLNNGLVWYSDHRRTQSFNGLLFSPRSKYWAKSCYSDYGSTNRTLQASEYKTNCSLFRWWLELCTITRHLNTGLL